MNEIGLYQFEQPTSLYIETLKEKAYTLYPLEKELDKGKQTMLEAVILDYSGGNSGESLGKICELLFRLKESEVPLIFILLQQSTPMERLIYLQLGATIVFDCQVKPNEFGIIVSNLLQPKTGLRQVVLEEKVESGLQLNTYNHSISLEEGQEAFLTPLEYKLVSYLKSKKDQGATYEEIYQALWQQEMGNQRYRVANLVFHIRTKIEKSSAHPKYLKTIRTIGYVLCI
ncbi:winged helix-turn-helix domain-containing protein [Enterococcus rotai]|uniref:winged helix-turn-helix domain-containing protein n=1 Tax=Enterococcus rotai TaxID=118060 RepID=UPI0032B45C94